MALDLHNENDAICWLNLKVISKLRDQTSLRWQLTNVHSKFVGHSTENIRQSKIKGPLLWLKEPLYSAPARTYLWAHINVLTEMRPSSLPPELAGIIKYQYVSLQSDITTPVLIIMIFCKNSFDWYRNVYHSDKHDNTCGISSLGSVWVNISIV